jgi:large subunit ribosomal protein L35
MANKVKTHSGAKKRFKALKGGKIKFCKAGRRHLLTKKTRATKRDMRKSGYLCNGDLDHIRSLLPYAR